MKTFFNKFDFIAEEGRQDIYNWSESRQKKYKGYRKSLHVFRIFAFNGQVLRSFFENFNFMVLLQMAVAGGVTYACKTLDIVYDVHVSLFISPIVFPLAFSINTDFQRKEKVLDDLASFKSSAMMWIFCMRDWREACLFDDQYMKGIQNKIKGLMFHLREYLLTEKIDRRQFIVRVIYEDLSDINQINEKVRCSNMTANSPLVSRLIHFLNIMCLSFERLRVIREYRSPRSIRSFTKVLIFVLPILLSPYYVFLGNKMNNEWEPYYICTMVAFVFGSLQGVQDKLDDPFDGMSEDDIKLDTLDEWTFQSLEATVHRTYKVGRFQVSSNLDKSNTNLPVSNNGLDHADNPKYRNHFLSNSYHYNKSSIASPRSWKADETDDFEFHPYAGVLHNIKGNTTILRGGQIKRNGKSYEDLNSVHTNSLSKETGNYSCNHVIFEENDTPNLQNRTDTTPMTEDLQTKIMLSRQGPRETLNTSQELLSHSRELSRRGSRQSLRRGSREVSPVLPLTTTPQLEFAEGDEQLLGVMSYIASMRLNQAVNKKGSRTNSLKSISSLHSNHSSSTSLRNLRSHSPSPSPSPLPSPSHSSTISEILKPEFFIGDSKPSDLLIKKNKSRFQISTRNDSSANNVPLLSPVASIDVISSDDNNDNDEEEFFQNINNVIVEPLNDLIKDNQEQFILEVPVTNANQKVQNPLSDISPLNSCIIDLKDKTIFI